MITPGRHPFEVSALAACAFAGGVMAAGGIRPRSIVTGLPEPLLTVWLALIAVGGVIGLLGVYWRGSVDDGLLIELVGVSMIAAACTLYVAALFAGNPVATAFGAAGLLSGIAAGAWWRAAQCWSDWRRVRAGSLSSVQIDMTLLTEERPGRDDDQGLT